MLRKKTAGPECPECACTDTELIQAGQTGHSAFARFECSHCGQEFTVGRRVLNGAAPYVFAVCVQCGSEKTRVVSSPAGAIRYHRCSVCNGTFKTAKG